MIYLCSQHYRLMTLLRVCMWKGVCIDWNRIQTTYVKTIRWGKNGQIKKKEEDEKVRRKVRKDKEEEEKERRDKR